MHWGNYRLFFSSILAFAIHLVDGCGRTPARPKPTPSTSPPHGKTTKAPGPPTTYAPNEYKLTCTKEDVKEAACLNGGECFALDLLNERSAHCTCLPMWTGMRCERIDENIFVLPREQVAGITTGVFLLLIIVTIIIVCLVIRLRRRRLKQRERHQNNGYVVCKSQIQDGTNVEYSPSYDYTCTEKSETNV